MKLFSHPFSPNCKRTRVLANELGLNLEVVAIDFGAGDNQKPDFLAKNPNGKVPVLVDGNLNLWESQATLVYLATKHPEKGFFPNDATQRADVMRWMFWAACHFEPAVNSVAFERLIKPMMMKQAGDDAKIEAATKDFNRFAPVLNGALEGKQFLLGDNYSIADIAVGITVEFAIAAQLDVKQYTHISAWLERLQARDAWKKCG